MPTTPSLLANARNDSSVVLRALFEGWALVETLAVSFGRLLAVAFLYLLVQHLKAGDPPSWDVLHETLDRLIQVVFSLPGLVR
jgi:hypothetical protein